MIAACSAIIAINIFEIKEPNYRELFQNCKMIKGKFELKVEMWNNEEIHKLTGYSIMDIK